MGTHSYILGQERLRQEHCCELEASGIYIICSRTGWAEWDTTSEKQMKTKNKMVANRTLLMLQQNPEIVTEQSPANWLGGVPRLD